MDGMIHFLYNSGFLIFLVVFLSTFIGIWISSTWFNSRIDSTIKTKRSSIQKKSKTKVSQTEIQQLRKEHELLDEISHRYYSMYLKSGDLKKDKQLGYIFQKRPSKTDDLSEIIGIGKVLHRKLNNLGVFTFKQIALWKKSQVKIFASTLEEFPDRVARDAWVAQAKRLHQNKYRETIK